MMLLLVWTKQRAVPVTPAGATSGANLKPTRLIGALAATRECDPPTDYGWSRLALSPHLPQPELACCTACALMRSRDGRQAGRVRRRACPIQGRPCGRSGPAASRAGAGSAATRCVVSGATEHRTARRACAARRLMDGTRRPTPERFRFDELSHSARARVWDSAAV